MSPHALLITHVIQHRVYTKVESKQLCDFCRPLRLHRGLHGLSVEGCEVDPCGICLDVLKDPHLTACCGQHYCKSCLTKWKKTCPQCRKENFVYIRNKSLIQEINGHTPNKVPGSVTNQSSIANRKFSCGKCKVVPVKDPCLTDCCGEHFCKTCLTEWLRTHPNKKICPHCRQENFTHILNKALKREIDEIFVRCIHLHDGCMWMGRKECLDNHLHASSSSVDCCNYVLVECPFKFCHHEFTHEKLDKHMKTCQHRPEKCTHCGLIVTHSAINLHHDECPEILLCCANRCSQKEMKRKELLVHYQTCPLEPLDCQFKNAGCTDKIVREDMDSHIEKRAHHHMLLLQKQNQMLRAQNWELCKRNHNLKKWNGELNNTLERLGYTQ